MQLVEKAIELAYERDYTHIPYVPLFIVHPSVLEIDRRGLTQYIFACILVHSMRHA
jgi:hypothetical protein